MSEGATEGAQQLWQNFNAATLTGYDPERKLDDEIYHSVVVGAIVGGTAAGAGRAGKSYLHNPKVEKLEERGFTDVPEALVDRMNKSVFEQLAQIDAQKAANTQSMAEAAGLQPKTLDEILAGARVQSDAQREAYEAEQRARAERLAQAKERREAFEGYLAQARKLLNADRPNPAAVKGVVTTLRAYVEDKAIDLSVAQQNEALALLRDLKPIHERLQKEEDAAAAARMAEQKAQAEREAAERKARIREEKKALKQDDKQRVENLSDDELYAIMAEEGPQADAAEAELNRRFNSQIDAAPLTDEEDLLSVLRKVKLPSKDSGLQDELDLLRNEGVNFGTRQQLFDSKKESLDKTAETLRTSYGFGQILTGMDVLDFAQRAINGERILPQPVVDFARKVGDRDSQAPAQNDRLPQHDSAPDTPDPFTGERSFIAGSRVTTAQALRIAGRVRTHQFHTTESDAGRARGVASGQLREYQKVLPIRRTADGLVNIQTGQRLPLIGKGVEAFVFEDTEQGVVYKVYAEGTSSDRSIGMRVAIEEGMAGLDTGQLPDIIEKTWVINDLGGTPTEIVGFTQDGEIVVKQPRGNDAARYERAQVIAKAHLQEVPADVLPRIDMRSPLYYSHIAGQDVLLGDLHGKNFIGDTIGRGRINDLATHVLTAAELQKLPKLGAWVSERRSAAQAQGSADFARAWHGSPHRGIEKEGFKLHKIGTGDGALGFGWGIYFSGDKDVAEEYRVFTERRAGQPANSGQLYSANIPEADELLDWDKKFSEQPPKVQEAIEAIAQSVPDKLLRGQPFWGQTGRRIYEGIGTVFNEITNRGNRLDNAKVASEVLLKHGIPGLRYQGEANSTAAGAATDNYVIWDESRLNNDIQVYYAKRRQAAIEEQVRELVATHNLTEENLLHAKKMGGIPTPSFAITKGKPPQNFGEIVLIGSRELIEPSRDTKVFGADIYSPQYPSVELKVETAAHDRFSEKLAPFARRVNTFIPDARYIAQNGFFALENNAAVMAQFLDARGKPVEERSQLSGWLRDKIEEAGLLGDYHAFVGEELAKMTRGEQIRQGTTNTGRPRYIPHTLENVVKILKKDLRSGTVFTGAGSVRAHLAPQFKSVAAIRKNKDRLATREQVEALREEVNTELSQITVQLSSQTELDSWAATRFMEVVAKDGLTRAQRGYGITLDAPTQERIAEFLDKLRTMPTEYFEGKLLRAVQVGEFSAAVVPKTIGPEALSYLREQGIKDIRTYDPQDRAAQARTVGEFQQLFFAREAGVKQQQGQLREDAATLRGQTEQSPLIAEEFTKRIERIAPALMLRYQAIVGDYESLFSPEVGVRPWQVQGGEQAAHIVNGKKRILWFLQQNLRADKRGLMDERLRRDVLHEAAHGWLNAQPLDRKEFLVSEWRRDLKAPDGWLAQMKREGVELREGVEHDWAEYWCERLAYENNQWAGKREHWGMAGDRGLLAQIYAEFRQFLANAIDLLQRVFTRTKRYNIDFRQFLTDPRYEAVSDRSHSGESLVGDSSGRQAVATAKAWHGSPHRGIEKEGFKLHQIGTGEGHQAYGWGIYFAGDKGISEYYRERLENPQYENLYKGEPLTDERIHQLIKEGSPAERLAFSTFDPTQYDNIPALSGIDIKSDFSSEISFYEKEIVGRLKGIERARERGDFNAVENLERISNDQKGRLEALREVVGHVESKKLPSSQLYSAEIPDAHELLDWDKRFSEQPERVKEAIQQIIDDTSDEILRKASVDIPKSKWEIALPYFEGWSLYMSIGEIALAREGKYYRSFVSPSRKIEMQKAASELLLKHGVPGLRYLDGNSRSSGEGTYNYVIWDESRLNNDIETYYASKAQHTREQIQTTYQLRAFRDKRYQAAKEAGQTELTASQWQQVHSPEFKAWFGDWERLRAQGRIDAMEPVELQLDEKYKDASTEDLREEVVAHLRGLAKGKKTAKHPQIGEVGFSSGRIGKVINTSAASEKLHTVLDIVRVIEASHLIESADSYKPKEIKEGTFYHTLATKVSAFGREFIAVITVKEMRSGLRFYNTIAVESVDEKASWTSPRASESFDSDSTSALHEAGRSKLSSLERVNPETVSDALNPRTGEPQIFYHGGGPEFTQIGKGQNFGQMLFLREGEPSGYGVATYPLYVRGKILELSQLVEILETERGEKLLRKHLRGEASEEVISELISEVREESPYPAGEEVWEALGAIDEADASNEYQMLLGKLARELGFQALRIADEFDGQAVAVVEPTAIKSAIGNRGTFDGSNPDISFARAAWGEVYHYDLAEGHERFFHGGRTEGLRRVEDSYTFGGVFASSDYVAARSHGQHMFVADIRADQVASNWDIMNAPAEVLDKVYTRTVGKDWKQHAELLEHAVEEDKGVFDFAEDEVLEALRSDDLAEAGWQAQYLRGQIGKELGFKAVPMQDEHGTSYLILPSVQMRSEKSLKAQWQEEGGDAVQVDFARAADGPSMLPDEQRLARNLHALEEYNQRIEELKDAQTRQQKDSYRRLLGERNEKRMFIDAEFPGWRKKHPELADGQVLDPRATRKRILEKQLKAEEDRAAKGNTFAEKRAQALRRTLQREYPETGNAVAQSPPNADAEIMRQIQSVIDAAKLQGNPHARVSLGPVTGWVADAVQERLGVDVHGYQHIVDVDGVRHMFKEHRNETAERNRGQVGITEADIQQIPNVIASPDEITLGGKTKGHKDAILYSKRMPDGTIFYVSEIRTGRRQLAAHTLYKRMPARVDGSLESQARPPYVRNDSGNALTVIPRPSSVKSDSSVTTDGGPTSPPQTMEGDTVRDLNEGRDHSTVPPLLGHTNIPPKPGQTVWQWLVDFIKGFRSFVPEVSARDITYAPLRQFYKAIKRATAQNQSRVQEILGRIVKPLLDAGMGKTEADTYRKLGLIQQRIRKLEAAGAGKPQVQADHAKELANLHAQVVQLNAQVEGQPYHLFNKIILAEDYVWRAENLKDEETGQPLALPDGISLDQAKAESTRLKALAQAHPQAAAINRAVQAHLELVAETWAELERRFPELKTVVQNPYYFPHHIINDKHPAKLARVRLDTAAEIRKYLIEPKGSVAPIETDYAAAMALHLSAVYAHNSRADLVRDLIKNQYDKMAELRERAKELSEERGERVGWQDVFNEEYKHSGYVRWTPDDRLHLHSEAVVDKVKLAKRLGLALGDGDLHTELKKAGITQVQLLPEDIREALTPSAKEEWIIPEKVAQALEAMIERESRFEGSDLGSGLARSLEAAQNLWKKHILFSPWNYIRYEYNNTTSDIEKLFSADPAVFGYLPSSLREVLDLFAADPERTPSADVRIAKALGVLQSVTIREAGELPQLKQFAALKARPERLRDIAKAASTLFLANGRSTIELSQLREATFRYAKFKADLDRMRNGARPVYAGAYHKDIEALRVTEDHLNTIRTILGDTAPNAEGHIRNEDVQKLAADTVRAAEISLATFGDYDTISVSGAALRKMMIPFYSWIEINFRYHANLFRNLRDMALAGDMSTAEARKAGTRAAGVLAATFTRKVAAFTAGRLALPYLAIAMWNNSGDNEEIEEELSAADRRRFHINLGRDKDGRARVIYAATALGDIMKWFGGDDLMRLAADLAKGRTTFAKAVEHYSDQFLPDLINNLAGGIGPVVKAGYTLASGKSTFPDITDQRSIPAYDLKWNILSQMTDGFTADMIRRVLDKDYLAPRDIGDWVQQLILQVRKRDAASWSFYAIKDKAADWNERRTGKSRGASDYHSPEMQVLRNYRRAIYKGDLKNAIRFYDRLLEFGYTAERLRTSSVVSINSLPRKSTISKTRPELRFESTRLGLRFNRDKGEHETRRCMFHSARSIGAVSDCPHLASRGRMPPATRSARAS